MKPPHRIRMSLVWLSLVLSVGTVGAASNARLSAGQKLTAGARATPGTRVAQTSAPGSKAATKKVASAASAGTGKRGTGASKAAAAADARKDAKEAPVRTMKDVRYGEHLLHGMDVYAAPDASGAPVVLFVHGGEFFEGDKRDHWEKGEAFARAGYVFAAMNFRLAPAHPHPAAVQDIAKAVAFLRDNARRWGGRSDVVFLMGHSSGAHLAALIGVDGQYLSGEGLAPSDLAGVVLLDGAGYDVPHRLAATNAHTKEVYHQAFGTSPAQWRAASPTRVVALGSKLPPFLLFYAGTASSPEKQSNMLMKALRWNGSRVERIHIPERNHVTLEKNLGRKGDSATYLARRFFLEQSAKRLDAELFVCSERAQRSRAQQSSLSELATAVWD